MNDRCRASIAALVLLTGCPEATPKEDAGPGVERPGIEPDLLLKAANGALRVGASKRDLSPQGYEVANPNYLGFRNPGNCDPVQKFRGAGHRHEVSFSQIQSAQVLGGARTEFILRDASVEGAGLHPDIREGGWQRIIDITYEGRGG